MNQVLTTVGIAFGTQVLALAALALRLRWQAVRDKRRQDTLGMLATRLPAAGVVEIHDVRDDGSHLRVRIAAGSDTAKGNDARSRAR